MRHYHIHWSDGKIDWEPFSTVQDARARADELLRLDETYTIDEFGDDCAHCSSLVRRALP